MVLVRRVKMLTLVPGLVMKRHGRWNISRIDVVGVFPRLMLRLDHLCCSATDDLGNAVLAKILIDGGINLGLSSG